MKPLAVNRVNKEFRIICFAVKDPLTRHSTKTHYLARGNTVIRHGKLAIILIADFFTGSQ